MSEQEKRTVQDRAQEVLVKAREFVANSRDQQSKGMVVAMGVAINELVRKLESQAAFAGVLLEVAGRAPTAAELAEMGNGRMAEWRVGEDG